MIDSHCHLGDEQFAEDLPAVLRRARDAGVEGCIAVGDSLRESARCLEVSEKYDGVYCTAGVHPHMSSEWSEDSHQQCIAMIRSSEKIVAVGEIGLDYHYDHSPRDVQRDALRCQLHIAKDLALPAVVHCREAIRDLAEIIREVEPPSLVLHCCTERWDDVAFLVDRGYSLSFTGIATYPKSEAIRETIRRCPLGQLMIETDAPYLAPVPYRRKRNEPAFVVEVAKLLSELRGIPLGEIDAITTANTVAFFGLPA